jgi:hypothetical protein
MLKLLSLVALLLTVLPSGFLATGAVTLSMVKWIALLGTVVWFIVTPLWMGRPLGPDADQVQI